MTRAGVISRLLVVLAIAGAAIWLGLNRDRLDPTLIESTVRDLGLLAPLAHVLLFAVATILFVPGLIFGLAGGALFGPVLGSVLNLAGATLGATPAHADHSPPTSVIVDRIMTGVTEGAVVLMHDGGGVRSHTIEAVAAVTPRLRADGWRLTVPARRG